MAKGSRWLCVLVAELLAVHSVSASEKPPQEHIPHPETKQPAKLVRWLMAALRGRSAAIYLYGARG